MKSTIAKVTARVIVLMVMIAALASPLFAQTSGRIVGTIEDAQGAVLPGVTVTVTSPQLQGASTAVTDANGQFRFPTLPPGAYHVKAELGGFKSVDNDVRVGIDQTVTLPIKMPIAGVAETVNVMGVSPVVDTTSAAAGITAGQDVFNQLPVARDFYGITKLAPGVTQDTYGPSINGSTSAENQYIIDGLNTTGVNTGTEGKTLNFDFVQEVEVKTGGLNAEYGRLTGGAVNVVTKSGGNQFHGDVFGFGEGGGLQAANVTGAKLPQTQTNYLNTAHRADYGGDLGGFLVKDKVWFFGAFDRVDQRDEATIIRPLAAPGSPAVGSTVPADISKNLFAAKGTFKLSQNHTLTATVFGDPTTRDGAIFTTANGQQFVINGPASTWQGTLDQGSVDTVGKYDGVFSNTMLLSVMGGQHREKNIYGGAGASTPQNLDQTVVPTQTSGGFTAYDNQNFKRNVIKGDLTKYWGSHTIKTGADYEDISAVVDRFEGGAGQRIYKLRQASTGIIYYRHRYYVDDQKAGFSRTDPTTWTILNPLEATPKTQNASFYAQDSYKVISNLSINYGIRWERQHVLGRDADAGFAVSNWAPRVGVVWDPTSTGKAKVYANWGRFYENIPQDINIRAFGGETQAFAYNFSPDAVQHDAAQHDAVQELAARRIVRTGRSEPEGPVHRRVHVRRRIRGDARLDVELPVHPPEPRPRDRGLPGAVERRVLHRQPRPGHARPVARLLRRRDDRAGAGSAAHQHQHRADAAEALQQELAGHGELRLLEARRQLRRHVPELDRAARSEHQLGVRLCRLPGERPGSVEQPAQEPAEVRRKLRRLHGALDGLNFGGALHWYPVSR